MKTVQTLFLLLSLGAAVFAGAVHAETVDCFYEANRYHEACQ